MRLWTLAVVAAQYLIEDVLYIVALRLRPHVTDASIYCVLLLSRTTGIVVVLVNTLEGGKTYGKYKIFGKNCSYTFGREKV
ncbi:MAG: hypothetical protein GX187_00980 [Clostridiaceae bacterium]|nr:hypothetical protein [Clostridiaceae bacterium]